MIQNVLKEIGGVGIYGVISICLFVMVFTGALLRAMLLKKPVLRALESLPMNDGTCFTTEKGTPRHE